MEEIEGATRDQYKHLRSYAAKILDKNKIMHSIQNKDYTLFSQKDKNVSLPCHQKQVKLFKMLQEEQTNYS